MIKNTYTNNRAFSLLEITVVIIIITILVSAAIPVISRSYFEKAGNKTALDMAAIQEAARAYYIDHNKWPDSSVYPTPLAALQAGNYLPSSWNAINPFGVASGAPANYAYVVSSTGTQLTVDTFVPIAAQTIIQNLLPTNWVSGNLIYSSVSVPGESSILPAGIILPWASNNLPAGFLWCNGQAVDIATYPGLYAVLGTTFGGDGINTFGLPDMMGRTIVGIDGMGGVNQVNRITQWSTTPATLGGTFGEDAHRQTVAQLAPHDHPENAYVAMDLSNSEGLFGSNPGGHAGIFSPVPRTGMTGGNNDNSGLGAPSNVVQPSIAMAYIIKY